MSLLDAPGQAFWDPEADAALFATIEERGRADRRTARSYASPHNINDPEFADAVLARVRRGDAPQ